MPKALRAALGAILLIVTIGLATCRSFVVDVQAAPDDEFTLRVNVSSFDDHGNPV